jgi:predicted HTH transcriptional regulator
MTLDDVKRIVARGEGQHIEFKRRVPTHERIAKEMIAFANTGGGTVLIGVNDDGSVVGVKDAEEEEFSLRQAVSTHCRPPVRWRSYRVPVTNKRDVIVVTVPRSRTKPHFLLSGEGDTKTAYIRVDEMSVEASPETVSLLRSETSTDGVHFEMGEVELVLLRYLEQYGSITVNTWANVSNTDRSTAGDLLVTLTRAGVLAHHAGERGDYFTLHFSD